MVSRPSRGRYTLADDLYIRVVVKIRVPFWILKLIRHLLFRVPQKGTLILTTAHILSKSLYLSIPSFRGGSYLKAHVT